MKGDAMKKVVGIIMLCFVNGALADTMAQCSAPDPTILRSAWTAFRTASLEGSAAKVAKFYRFPLKLLSPYDDVAPAKVSQKFFMRKYSQIFQKSGGGENSSLQKALLQTTEKEHITKVPFDVRSCNYAVPTRISEYIWVFDKRKGWLVDAVYLGDEYEEVAALIKGN